MAFMSKQKGIIQERRDCPKLVMAIKPISYTRVRVRKYTAIDTSTPAPSWICNLSASGNPISVPTDIPTSIVPFMAGSLRLRFTMLPTVVADELAPANQRQKRHVVVTLVVPRNPFNNPKLFTVHNSKVPNVLPKSLLIKKHTKKEENS